MRVGLHNIAAAVIGFEHEHGKTRLERVDRIAVYRLLAVRPVQQIEQAKIDRSTLDKRHAVDVDLLAICRGAAARDRIHDEMARAVQQHRHGVEALLHRVFRDRVPNRRGTVVLAEGVVYGGGEVKALAHDRDDLAIAGVARARDGGAVDRRRDWVGRHRRAGRQRSKNRKCRPKNAIRTCRPGHVAS